MRKITSLLMLVTTWSATLAQIPIDENKYSIDETRHLIVCNQLPALGQSPASPVQIKLGARIFTFSPSVQSLIHSTKYSVSSNGTDYALYFSQFPLVSLNVPDPAKINQDDEIPGSIVISDPGDASSEATLLSSNMAIRIRGNSSAFFPKKNYRVQFKDAGGKNKDETILGLRSDKRWLFFGMWNEEIRSNNVISHKLWIDMHKLYYAGQEPKALSSIRMKYVEVFMNNSYIGLYAVAEDMDRKQLQLKKEDSSGSRGELFKADDWSLSSSFGGLGGPKPALGTTDWQNWQLEYPDASDWTNHYNFLKAMIETSDEEFKNTVWNNLKQESAIDYFIFINLMRAEDNAEKNYFIARYDKGEPWFFVPWDLDGTWGYMPDGSRSNATDGERTTNLYKRLIKLNPDGFKNKLATRYFALRQNLLSETALKERFSNNYNTLNSNLIFERDNGVSADNYGQANRSGGLNYTLSFITERLVWLDKYFCPMLASGSCSGTPTEPDPDEPSTTPQSVNVCVEAENSNGNGSVSGDPNASGTSTRGDENNYDRYVDYVVNDVPSAGTYKLKITYFASGTPVIRISVNGNTVTQSIQLPSTHSWNIVNREQEMNITLVKGNNTIRIQGLPGASLRQDKICVEGEGVTTPTDPTTEEPTTEEPTTEEPTTEEPTTSQSVNICVEAENSNGNGQISSDPNASGTRTRGDQDNYDRYVDYVVYGIPSAGTYKLKITYFASGSPAVRISVNGNTAISSYQLPSTHSWNIVNREVEMNIALVKGNNTIRIQGLPGAPLRQDKICVEGEGTTTTPQNPDPNTPDPNTGDPETEEPPVSTPGSFNACLEAEDSNGNGPISGDPNASGQKTRGDQNNFDHYVDYVVNNVPAAGVYKLKITYFASGKPSIRVSVNGITGIQSKQLPSTYTWNIVNREETMDISLVKGNNTIRIQGLSGPSLRQDKICVTGSESSARMSMEKADATGEISPEKLNVFPNPSSSAFEARFDTDSQNETHMMVTDAQGRIWLNRKIKGNGSRQENISLPGAPSGHYILIINNGGKIKSKKLILVR